MTQKISLAVILLIFSFGLAEAPTASARQPLTFVVDATTLNVREAPGSTMKVVDRLGQGGIVQVFDRSGPWVSIELPGPANPFRSKLSNIESNFLSV